DDGPEFRVGGAIVRTNRNFVLFRWGEIHENRWGAPNVSLIGCFRLWFVVRAYPDNSYSSITPAAASPLVEQADPWIGALSPRTGASPMSSGTSWNSVSPST